MTDETTERNWKTEFPDFDHEPPLEWLASHSFTDVSWCNEPCPSWECDVFVIWIDYLDPAKREVPEATLYSLQDEGRTVLATNDWADVRAFVEDGKRDFGAGAPEPEGELKHHLVEWRIDVEATHHSAAAVEAYRILRRPKRIGFGDAVCFVVHQEDGAVEEHVDLDEMPDQPDLAALRADPAEYADPLPRAAMKIIVEAAEAWLEELQEHPDDHDGAADLDETSIAAQFARRRRFATRAVRPGGLVQPRGLAETRPLARRPRALGRRPLRRGGGPRPRADDRPGAELPRRGRAPPAGPLPRAGAQPLRGVRALLRPAARRRDHGRGQKPRRTARQGAYRPQGAGSPPRPHQTTGRGARPPHPVPQGPPSGRGAAQRKGAARATNGLNLATTRGSARNHLEAPPPRAARSYGRIWR